MRLCRYRHNRKILDRLAELFPNSPNRGRAGFGQIRAITRGDHARVHQGLLYRAVERLRRADVEVIIVEAPVHPLGAELYDVTLRADFVSFASGLANDLGARFLPLEQSGSYELSDFADLTHLNLEGSAKLTRAIVAAVGALFEFDVPEVS